MNKPLSQSPLRENLSEKLQTLSSQMRLVKLKYYRGEAEIREAFGLIKNMYSKKKEKYVLLSGGEEIKVNSILSVQV